MDFKEKLASFNQNRAEIEVKYSTAIADLKSEANMAVEKAINAARVAAIANMKVNEQRSFIAKIEAEGQDAGKHPRQTLRKLIEEATSATDEAKATKAAAEKALRCAVYDTKEDPEAGVGSGKGFSSSKEPKLAAQALALSDLLETAGTEAIEEHIAAVKEAEVRAAAEFKARRAAEEAALAAQREQMLQAAKTQEAQSRERWIADAPQREAAERQADEAARRFQAYIASQAARPPTADSLRREFMEKYDQAISKRIFSIRNLKEDPSLAEIIDHATHEFRRGNVGARTVQICQELQLIDEKGYATEKTRQAIADDMVKSFRPS